MAKIASKWKPKDDKPGQLDMHIDILTALTEGEVSEKGVVQLAPDEYKEKCDKLLNALESVVSLSA